MGISPRSGRAHCGPQPWLRLLPGSCSLGPSRLLVGRISPALELRAIATVTDGVGGGGDVVRAGVAVTESDDLNLASRAEQRKTAGAAAGGNHLTQLARQRIDGLLLGVALRPD